MRRCVLRNLCYAGALALLVLPTMARAQTVNASFNGLVGGTGTIVSVYGNNESTASTGEFLWQGANPAGLLKSYAVPGGVAVNDYGIVPVFGSSDTDFISFCLETSQSVFPTGNYSFELRYDANNPPDPPVALGTAPIPGDGGVPMGTTAAELLEALWYAHITSPANAASYALGSNENVGAFQIAVYKLTYDNANNGTANPDDWFDLTKGNVRSSGGDAIIAQQWLNDLKTQYNPRTGEVSGPLAQLGALVLPNGQNPNAAQDQLVEISRPGYVPEPGSIAIWTLLGACGLVWKRRLAKPRV